MVSTRHSWLNTSFLVDFWIDRSLQRGSNKALWMSWHILLKFFVHEPLLSLWFHVVLRVFRAHKMPTTLTRHHCSQSLVELLWGLRIWVTKAQILLNSLSCLLTAGHTILNWIGEHPIQCTSIISRILLNIITSLRLSYSSSHSPRFLNCCSGRLVSSWSIYRIQTNIPLTNRSRKLRHIINQALDRLLHYCINSILLVYIKVITSGSIWGAKITLRVSSKLTLRSL